MATHTADSHARPLLWWCAAQLADLARRVQPAWDAWLRDWVPVAGAGQEAVDCALAGERQPLAASRWVPLGPAGNPGAWLCIAGGDAVLPLLLRVARDAFSAAAQPIASAAAREAQDDLEQRLRDCLAPLAADAPLAPAQLFRPWSGAVVVALGRAGTQPALHLLLAPQTVAALVNAAAPAIPPAAPSPVVPLEEALADQPVRLQVRLAPCDIELGVLSELGSGDIVPLPHALDVPLAVLLDGQPVCSGFLGRQGRTRAIELVRAPDTTPSR